MAAKQKPRKQLDSLKWLESAAATKDSRPVLTAGYISNGAAAFADVKPRLTHEKIAEFQRVEALQAAEAAAV